MSNIRLLKRTLADVSRLRDAGDIDGALVEVESLLESWPGNPHLHILKASLVQLQEDPKIDLDQAKRNLHQAMELDSDAPAAFIEMGYFLDNVEDDPQSAVKAFGDGVAIARRFLIEGLVGQAKAYRQLGKKDDLVRCLDELLHLASSESTSRQEKTEETGTEFIVQSAKGDIFTVQRNGQYAEQIAGLLGDMNGEYVTRLSVAGASG